MERMSICVCCEMATIKINYSWSVRFNVDHNIIDWRIKCTQLNAFAQFPFSFFLFVSICWMTFFWNDNACGKMMMRNDGDLDFSSLHDMSIAKKGLNSIEAVHFFNQIKQRISIKSLICVSVWQWNDWFNLKRLLLLFNSTFFSNALWRIMQMLYFYFIFSSLSFVNTSTPHNRFIRFVNT